MSVHRHRFDIAEPEFTQVMVITPVTEGLSGRKSRDETHTSQIEGACLRARKCHVCEATTQKLPISFDVACKMAGRLAGVEVAQSPGMLTETPSADVADILTVP